MKRSEGDASTEQNRHRQFVAALRWPAVAAMKVLFGVGLVGALVYALIAFVLALRLGGSQTFAVNCAWIVFVLVLFTSYAADGLELQRPMVARGRRLRRPLGSRGRPTS